VRRVGFCRHGHVRKAKLKYGVWFTPGVALYAGKETPRSKDIPAAWNLMDCPGPTDHRCNRTTGAVVLAATRRGLSARGAQGARETVRHGLSDRAAV
jgi:hypothetical protein